MTLQLKTKARLFDLHCSVGLTDWDMDKELKLATTTDQFYHDDKLNDQYVVQRPSVRASRRKDEFIWYDKTSDTFVKPNLWLLVNPTIACPMQFTEDAAGLRTLGPAEDIQTALLDPAETQRQRTIELHMFAPHDAPLHSVSSSTEYMVQVTRQETQRCISKGSEEEDCKLGDMAVNNAAFQIYFANVYEEGNALDMFLRPQIKNEDVSCQPAKNRRKGRTTKARDSKTLKPGCWPRPPVNYCILISLALKSSHTGSLKVQQIYHFTREHFPFFQTAPDGWKNTIRHNLCFNNSFRKTCNQLFRDGKRKSCFWHLTLDGQRRLRDEIRTLTGESFKQLERSMSHPDVIRSLLAL